MRFFLIETAHAGVISEAPTVSDVLSKTLQFLLSVAGIFAILALVVSGLIYITAGGDEERARVAKKAALYSASGIAVVLASLVLVRQLGAFFN